jgi:hypothetical protein
MSGVPAPELREPRMRAAAAGASRQEATMSQPPAAQRAERAGGPMSRAEPPDPALALASIAAPGRA